MKRIMFFIVSLVFSGFVYADACIAGSDSCGVSDEEACIPAEMMKEIRKSNKILDRAPDLVESKWIVPRTISFDVTIDNDLYTVYSLTNFRDADRNIHDLVSSIKLQGYGDCTRFAATGAIEIKLAKQYSKILQKAKDVVASKGGDPATVEANLSEAYAKEIAGCEDHGTNVMKRLAARGIVQEEHYPYHARSFGEAELYSKRDIRRYEDFVNINKDCNKEKSWNKKLQDKAKDKKWLRFQPGEVLVIKKDTEEKTLRLVEMYISLLGEPVVLTYNYSCLSEDKNNFIDLTQEQGWNMGKFTRLQYFVNQNSKEGGHAVIIVGYMKPANNGNGTEYFIVKNSHHSDNTLELFPVNQSFQDNCEPEYNIFREITVFHGSKEIDESKLADIDDDNDGIPDIFDNSVYSLDYFSDLPNVSYNPAQDDVDNDGIPIERDLCPYIKDIAQADMDMDGVGDFCDGDIDGDGISNIDEGLSKEYLYNLSNHFFVLNPYKLTEKEYAALNPFIDGKTGKISGKYFVSEKFVEGKKEELVLTDKYISSIDFYLLPFSENIENTPKYQFIKDFSYFHDWYSGFSTQNRWRREFHYKDEKEQDQTRYGWKWNVPGLFEMANISYNEYRDDNYGENYPENFFNCMLHCKKLDELYSNKASFFDQSECEKACRNAYQCTEGEGIDRDCDGIRNKYDNCPDNYNPEQLDSDGDGIGDECDNCPNHQNPIESYSLNSEFISGSNGAMAQRAGKFVMETPGNFFYFRYEMQPDNDLDGIGDVCDFGSTGDGFANSKIKSAYNFLSISKTGMIENKSSLTLKLSMPENSGRGLNFCENTIFQIGTTCNAAVHYCAITKQQNDDGWWGRPGFCSTSDKAGGSISGVNFGYSHGSDDFSQESIRSWRSRISVADSAEEARGEKWGDPNKFVNSNDPNDDPIRKLVKVNSIRGGATIWNWRRDWYEKNLCYQNSNSSLCQSLLNGGDQDEDNTMYAAISTSIVPINLTSQQIPPYILSLTTINPTTTKTVINNAYFPPTNLNKFARASRYKIEPIELNYWTAKLSMPNPNTDIIFQKPVELPNIDLCASCYFDMPIRYFGINEIQPYEYVSRYEIRKDSKNKVLLDSQRIMFHKDQIAFSEISPKEMIGIETNGKEYFLTINTSESGADWNRIGRIENWDPEIGEIESFSANYFIAKNANGVKTLYSLELISEIPQNFDAFIDDGELPEMVYTANNLGETGFDHELTKLVFANGRLYLFANSGNGFGTYLHNGKIFEEIQGLMPQQRKIVNVSVSGRYLFLAGGTDFNNETMNDLWRFDTEANSWEQIPVTLQGDFSKVIMQEAGGKIVGFNPIIDDNTTFPVFEFENLEDVENIEVSYSQIKIENLDFEQTFCIAETDKTIFPGITNFYGECVKVENYDFDEVTFPDYKLSVAGYRNSLYLGGLTGIRRVEIGENGKIKNKEIVYSGESNNLAVYGNTLYAANYSEIDIFEIAEDGSISRKSSVKTSNCKNIRIDGGKLFAAENKRVRIFDLSDPIEPELLKTISLSNTVEDLEIAGNQLFVYENLNGLLTRKGKVSVFDISDLENTQKVSDFSQYCNDPEMQKSGNSVYLGCKNGSFKVEETGLQKVNGSKNYLREGYVFDGILYQVFSGTLHLSSLKTEEIQEDGWL